MSSREAKNSTFPIKQIINIDVQAQILTLIKNGRPFYFKWLPCADRTPLATSLITNAEKKGCRVEKVCSIYESLILLISRLYCRHFVTVLTSKLYKKHQSIKKGSLTLTGQTDQHLAERRAKLNVLSCMMRRK